MREGEREERGREGRGRKEGRKGGRIEWGVGERKRGRDEGE